MLLYSDQTKPKAFEKKKKMKFIASKKKEEFFSSRLSRKRINAHVKVIRDEIPNDWVEGGGKKGFMDAN